jgi:hypothetical protein
MGPLVCSQLTNRCCILFPINHYLFGYRQVFFYSIENDKSQLHCNRKLPATKSEESGGIEQSSLEQGQCSLLVPWCANLSENGRSIAVGRKGSREVDSALFFPRGSCSRRRSPQYDKTAACTSYIDGRLHGASISTILRFKP